MAITSPPAPDPISQGDTAARSGGARAVAGRTLVGLIVGAVMVVAFLRILKVSAVYHRLAHLRIGFGLLCGIAFLGAYVVRALRWRMFLRPSHVGVGRAVAIYEVATFLNWLLPIRGGELAKSLLLRRLHGVPISRSLATVGMDKAMDLLPAVGLLVLLPVAGLHLSRALWLLLLAALAVVGLVSGLLVFAAWRPQRAMSVLSRPLCVLLRQRARQRIEPSVALFIDTLLALIRQPRVVLAAAAYTACAVCLDALFCWLAFKAVGLAVAVPVVLYGYTFYNLAFILPTPPGQVGSNELMGLLIFSGMFGLNRSGVGAMFLFSHPWTAVLMTVIGLICLSVMGLSLRATLRLATAAADGGEP
jgi:uncharacterized protein (TIRG00374 family)